LHSRPQSYQGKTHPAPKYTNAICWLAPSVCTCRRDGVLWEIGELKDVGHLLQGNGVVEGIHTGAEAIAVNWIEAIEPINRVTGPA
jgi:hypothetical protein